MDDESNGECGLVRTAADRIGVIVIATILWSIAAWMFWFVAKFAGGDAWWEFAVRVVLDEFAFAIGVLGLAFFAQAAFPQRAGDFVDKAAQKVALIAFGLLGLFVATFVLVALFGFVSTLLRALG